MHGQRTYGYKWVGAWGGGWDRGLPGIGDGGGSCMVSVMHTLRLLSIIVEYLSVSSLQAIYLIRCLRRYVDGYVFCYRSLYTPAKCVHSNV